MMKKTRVSLLALLSLCLVILCQSVYAEKFTIAVLPDTQNEVKASQAMFASQMNWLVKNKRASNIAFVLHVGDVVDSDSPDHIQWKTASDGFKILDKARIPYAIAPGNHDSATVMKGGPAGGSTNANLRNTEQFNTFFPVSRFKAQQGRFEKGKSDNAWYKFETGSAEWIVLTLEPWARQSVVDWAKTVLAENAQGNVIVVTHSFLAGDGKVKKDNGGYGDLSPQSIYDQLISQYPNVLLVLSGHEGSSAWRSDVGVKGNRVYEILQDYQDQDSGNGYMRLLEVDTTEGKISARVYSPYLDKTLADSSAFTLDNVRFILETDSTAGGQTPSPTLRMAE